MSEETQGKVEAAARAVLDNFKFLPELIDAIKEHRTAEQKQTDAPAAPVAEETPTAAPAA